MGRKLDTWEDPSAPESFRSKRRWQTLTNLSTKKLTKFFSKQDGFILHQTPRRKFHRRKTISTNINYQWAADLADMSHLATENDGVNFIMVMIDVISRKLFTAPMIRKHATSALKVLKEIFKSSGVRPKTIQYDKGGEFKNNSVAAYLKTLKVKPFSSEDDTVKASLAERVIRTLKRRIYMYMTQKNTRRYIDKLSDFVNSYNNSYHRSIGMTPNQVTNEKVIFAIYHDQNRSNLLNKAKTYDIKVGDTVKLQGRKKLMDRGFQIQWTEENFIVKRKLNTKPVTYLVEDLLGEQVKGSWYGPELQVVEPPEFYQIEKKVKSRVRNGKKEWLIKWLGYSDKFNTWEPASEIP